MDLIKVLLCDIIFNIITGT